MDATVTNSKSWGSVNHKSGFRIILIWDEFRKLGNATDSQGSRRGTSWSHYEKAGTNAASVGGGDAGNSQKHRLTNSVEYAAFSQPASCRGDDGRTTGLDGCLLTHAGLDYWLTSATIPSFNRLTRREVAALTSKEQAEYRQLYAEYQSLRKQQTEQIKALGNAIVPQCAALIFERLKRILSQQQKNP